MNDLYLMHHGIKGMHWGVRRYENYDGTLTPAGEKRYLKKLNKAARREAYSNAQMLDNASARGRMEAQAKRYPQLYKKSYMKKQMKQTEDAAIKWAKTNQKDIERVKKLMSKMNLKDKHLTYDPINNVYGIEENR
jgi:spore coat polysaccharide biosynthesis protein SpsF (cytidylyltransferase family)